VFRDEVTGRQAFVLSTGLAAWELVKLSRAFDCDPVATAEYLQLDPALVAEGLEYARLHPDEISAAIRNHESFDLEKLSRVLPGLEIFQPPNDAEHL
jgi:hypothetical protein